MLPEWRLVRRARGAAAAALAAGLGGAAVTAGAGERAFVPPPGCFRGAEAPVPAESTPAGEIVLAGGDPARLAGLVPGPAEADGAGLDAGRLAAALKDAASVSARTSGRQDRWGRWPVEVLVQGELLAGLLLSEGAATVLPGELPAACTRALLLVEQRARAQGRGRWAGGAGIFDAADAAGLASRAGRFTIVEGRVAGLGQTSARFYLNFGHIRGQSFTVTVPRRALQKIEASGMRMVSLEGRRIRVRGVVLVEGGPHIEVTRPEEIERLDEGSP